MTLPDTLIPTWTNMLGALWGWLDKAEAERGPESAGALLGARLAPDMYPLATQIRFACVQVLEGLARLRGEALPDAVQTLLAEGRGGAPGTLAEARARITETLAAVERAAPTMPALDPATPIAHTLPQGMVFDLDAAGYVRDWALPQFYFHLMAAYAILRAEGVGLGKADYVAHMFRYLRPGTMPGA